MKSSVPELGRTAYEARFEGVTLGPRGVAPAWADLLPVHKAIWARVEEIVHAADRKDETEPEVIAAAWDAWRSRGGWKLGPGPAFREAIRAALRIAAGLPASTHDRQTNETQTSGDGRAD